MFVRKTILIHKSPNEIFPLINNFNSWPQWSPWLIADPNTRLDFENNGKYYRWKSSLKTGLVVSPIEIVGFFLIKY
jgi:ribosome-associated toxin RatA of RatAB toxin-antitoxin module